MNKWVLEKRREAFSAYKKHIAMFLHFRNGSDYDYSRYNGATSVTLESFMRKDPKFIQKYILLKHHTKNVDLERFLFANYLNDTTHIDDLIKPSSMETFNIWSITYGNSTKFEASCIEQLKIHHSFSRFRDDHSLFVYCLRDLIRSNTMRLDDTELIAWGLNREPSLYEMRHEDVFHESIFERLDKVISLYKYFAIL